MEEQYKLNRMKTVMKMYISGFIPSQMQNAQIYKFHQYEQPKKLLIN